MYQPINIHEHVWQNGGDKLVFEIYDVMCCFQKPFSFSQPFQGRRRDPTDTFP